jgi:hypothetical protein
MNMKRAILLAAVAIALMAGLSAQDKPNFAGTWRSPSGSDRWTIAVEGSKMTVTYTVAGNSASTVYMLDGTPSKNNLSKDGVEIEQIYSSKWEDNVLVTTITTGNSTRIERRSIEADGTMKIGSTITVQGKPVSPPPLVLKKIG